MSGEFTLARAEERRVVSHNRSAKPSSRFYRRVSKSGERMFDVNVSVRLTEVERDFLALSAARRSLTQTGLMRKVIERVLQDDLLKAVLDD